MVSDHNVSPYHQLQSLMPCLSPGREGQNSSYLTLLKQGYHAIHFAAHYGHLETVKALITDSATVDVLDKETKTTPLIEAAKCGHVEAVKLLEGAGGNIHMADKLGKTVSQ